jgi:hypothetical protein
LCNDIQIFDNSLVKCYNELNKRLGVEKMNSIKNQRKGPVRHHDGNDSKERLDRLAHLLPSAAPPGFDPACISWVTDRIGITAVDGVDDALDEGSFVINVADEIWNDANEKVSIEPYSGTVLQALDEVNELVIQVLTTSDRKVVIHCAMGMERSVLAVVWHLHRTGGLSLDEAYDAVRRARPIALDRRAWIKS